MRLSSLRDLVAARALWKVVAELDLLGAAPERALLEHAPAVSTPLAETRLMAAQPPSADAPSVLDAAPL